MSFVLTAVCSGAAEDGLVKLSAQGFVIERVESNSGAKARAGYLPGLVRHLGRSVHGPAVYILLDDGDGYLTSNDLFPFPDDDEEPVRMAVPDEYRKELHSLLAQLLRASPEREVVLIAEYNGSVTDPEELDADVDVLGPWDMEAFWAHHDIGEIFEESIILLRENR